MREPAARGTISPASAVALAARFGSMRMLAVWEAAQLDRQPGRCSNSLHCQSIPRHGAAPATQGHQPVIAGHDCDTRAREERCVMALLELSLSHNTWLAEH